MNLWLDDIRVPPRDDPEHWYWVTSAEEAIRALQHYHFKEASLDHDLGEGRKTGYDVLCWIEGEVIHNPKFVVPILKVHSANPAGVVKMNQAIKTIQRLQDFDMNSLNTSMLV